MGRRGASNQPANAYVPPHARNNQATNCGYGDPEGYKAATSYDQPQPQRDVSQLTPYELLNSWYGYGNDNMNAQAKSAAPTSPYFSFAQNAGLQRQLSPQRYPPQQRGPLNPQANSYRPGRSVDANYRYPANGFNKYSRYNPPQTRSQQRAIHSLSADQPIPSIETSTNTTTQPPWRLPLRNDKPKAFTTRQSRSATPGIPDRSVTPPLAPQPSKVYLEHASATPERLAKPRKLLVLLDLNGTLLYRPRLADNAPRGARREHILRPGVQKLVNYLFENHAVMVYTSAMRHNAQVCVEALFSHLTPEQRGRLIDIRPRDQLGLTKAQLNARVQVYKPLEPVWALEQVVANGKLNECKWDETNTVLLDDSIEKARGNPHSLLQIPEFKLPDGTKEHNMSDEIRQSEQVIMKKVQQKLEELKWEVSITCKIREWQEKKETLVDRPEDVESPAKAEAVGTTKSALDAQAAADVAAAASYPTPESTGPDENEGSEAEGEVGIKSPTPVVEADFAFVDGSKKKEVTMNSKRFVDLSQDVI